MDGLPAAAADAADFRTPLGTVSRAPSMSSQMAGSSQRTAPRLLRAAVTGDERGTSAKKSALNSRFFADGLAGMTADGQTSRHYLDRSICLTRAAACVRILAGMGDEPAARHKSIVRRRPAIMRRQRAQSRQCASNARRSRGVISSSRYRDTCASSARHRAGGRRVTDPPAVCAGTGVRDEDAS